MTGREANRELRRSASSLLRKNGNDPDKALVAFCNYLMDGATPPEIFSAFARAIAAHSDPANGIEEDARPYLVKLAQSMPRIVS
ncbi:MAG TPA: hypothetical protein VKE94_13990 [Gemmataceae bacterium]|nr:hypothetical protein [Gemmataceae bacterium]